MQNIRFFGVLLRFSNAKKTKEKMHELIKGQICHLCKTQKKKAQMIKRKIVPKN